MSLAASLVVVGCGGSVGHRDRPTLSVSPTTGLADGSLVLRVPGLRRGELVTVQATAVDATGRRWIATARYRAGGDGAVSTATAAPEAGSYHGVDSVGLLWSMTPADGSDPRLAFFVPPVEGWTVTFRAIADGRLVGEANARRLMQGRGVVESSLAPRTAGFVGRYFTRPSHAAPAVLVFDGSDPGLQVPLDIASLMASHGVPALALCYFGCPGLRGNLQRIPLEYFLAAAKWLARQRGIDERRLWVLGISRGSEAALLLGAQAPALVHGVVAIVPSDVVNEALLNFYRVVPDSPWTLNGRPLPYTKQFGNPIPTDVPAAIIPVEKIDGPILLIAAQDDRVWPSPAYSRAIMARLRRYGRPFTRLLLDLPDAGHDMSETVPNLPAGTSVPFQRRLYSLGGTRATNQAAKTQAWRAILGFIKAH